MICDLKNIEMDETKPNSIISYIVYYNKFIKHNRMLKPPKEPVEVKFKWQPWKTKRVNRILKENYKNKVDAYDYYKNMFKLNKCIERWKDINNQAIRIGQK